MQAGNISLLEKNDTHQYRMTTSVTTLSTMRKTPNALTKLSHMTFTENQAL